MSTVSTETTETTATTATPTGSHGDGGAPPLGEPVAARRPSAAAAARTIVEEHTVGSLATLTVDPAGHPFGSLAPFALLDDGSPLLCLSTWAEHTRNLTTDPRASLLVTEPAGPGDPMDNGRLTLLGTAHRIDPERIDDRARDDARERFLARHPRSASYVDFGDFGFWALHVASVRWVGGFGRMAWCSADDYRAAAPDPVAGAVAGALEHLNADHADALLAVARAFTGFTDATSASAVRIDRYGIDLDVHTPRGVGTGRAPWEQPLTEPGQLRLASVALTRAARAALALLGTAPRPR